MRSTVKKAESGKWKAETKREAENRKLKAEKLKGGSELRGQRTGDERSPKVDLPRKGGAEGGLRQGFPAGGDEKCHGASFGAGPELPAAKGGAEFTFVSDLFSSVGQGEDFDADFRGNGEGSLTGVILLAAFCNPSHIRNAHFAALVRLDGTFGNYAALGHQGSEEVANLILKFTMARPGGAHFEGASRSKFDLEWKVAQGWIGTDLTPSKDRRHE